MEKDIPDQESDAAQRGSLGHWAMEQVLTNKELWPTVIEKITESPFGDEDLIEEVQFCYQFAENFRPSEWEYHLEQHLDLSAIHEAIGFGTADLVAVKTFDSACVFDWKFGRSAVSKASDNVQTACYAVGASKAFSVGRVVCYVVQAPFRFISTYENDTDELQNAEIAARMIVNAALPPDAPRMADAHACRFCKASSDCPEAKIFNTQLACLPKEKIDLLPTTALAHLLKQCDLAEEIVGAVKRRAYALLEAGGTIPGYALKPGRQMRAWADDAAKKLTEVAAKLKQPSDSIWAERALLSPAQLEKAWGKASKGPIETLVTKKQTRSILVEDDR
jgi:hypothetical protein